MSKFIKISNLLLNTNYITKIVIQPNKYYIHIANKKVDGFSWNLAGFGIGTISSYNSEVEICKTKDLTDYNIISDWISKNE
jgi:hypothetical protein